MNIVNDLRQLLGEGAVLDAAEVSERASGIWDPTPQSALALVRPVSTEEVSRVMAYCHERGISVVTQGGLTGLVRGQIATANQLVLSLERMRVIEQIDPIQRVATVQAGVTLQALQEAVAPAGLLFPLDLGARGSATLGGNAATNAGGNRVIRYGMMRDMVLGLEVVLADGTIVDALHPLIKNNTGYDLKQWFVGSEGTLGVITRLQLRLREAPASHDVAMVAAPDFSAVTGLLRHMDRSLGGTLSAFEVMWPEFYALVTTPPAKNAPPLPPDLGFKVLVESLGGDREADNARFLAALEGALDEGLISDAVVAQTDRERSGLWAIRDDVEQVGRDGESAIFDVSLPITAMEVYIHRIRAGLEASLTTHQLFVFGHLGDGNLHVVVQVPRGQLASLRPIIEAHVYEPLIDCRGSVSAEHGIGLEKREWLPVSRNKAELALMRAMKSTLDPKGILNPGKIFEA
ncbi:MAG: FAD-binding oxidoreductase [Halieaceae bacterium]|jgi:FAD/FMN-containing dehydrogenase|nr:FAD-binding oxidoreductase [Halieaceae bacterium]